MKKIIILIPVFNDWESLSKLIAETSLQIKNLKEYIFNYIIVNDGSTLARPNIKVPDNIDGIKIINMKTNKGHTTCIAYGIHHITQNEKFDKLISNIIKINSISSVKRFGNYLHLVNLDSIDEIENITIKVLDTNLRRIKKFKVTKNQ